MTTRGATLAALLATLVRPSWWVLGLAGFLVRGGIGLFLLGVVTLPSPLALAPIAEPFLRPFVFGGWTPLIVVVLGLLIGSAVAWIVVGGWIAAATEVILVRDARHAAPDEGLAVRPDGPPRRWLIARVTTAHFLAHAPLAVVLAFGAVSISSVVYRELVTPFDVSEPLALRVVRAAIGPIAAIVGAWTIGEIAGGLAARRIVVLGESIVAGVVRAYGEMLVRPLATLAPALLTLAILAIEILGTVAAVSLAWTATRSRLADLPVSWPLVGLALLAFAAAWCLALVVAGIGAAWRSVAMTFETERAAAAATGPILDGRSADDAAAGTIGASAHHRPGDWSAGSPGGSL